MSCLHLNSNKQIPTEMNATTLKLAIETNCVELTHRMFLIFHNSELRSNSEIVLLVFKNIEFHRTRVHIAHWIFFFLFFGKHVDSPFVISFYQSHVCFLSQIYKHTKDNLKNQQISIYFIVLSQLPETNRLISGIQATSLTGASCMATVTAWPPDNKGHILTCLSQPPENTVVPSSFHAEHKT